MFFTIIGLGVFVYGVFFTILTLISDCDLELFFYEKFGKSPSKYSLKSRDIAANIMLCAHLKKL